MSGVEHVAIDDGRGIHRSVSKLEAPYLLASVDLEGMKVSVTATTDQEFAVVDRGDDGDTTIGV